MSEAKPSSARLPDIDRAKGFAIFLVVVGHLISRGEPFSDTWYRTLKFAIYSFHMPFFMYLSGFVFFYSDACQRAWNDFFNFLKSRTYRLVVPGILFGIFLFAAKFFASKYMHVPNIGDDALNEFAAMALHPSTGPVQSIWYVFVLFIYCIITPPAYWISGKRLLPWIIFALFLRFLRLPDAFFLQKAGIHWVYFLVGGWTALNSVRILGIYEKLFPIFLLMFAASLAMIFWPVPFIFKALLPSFLSIPVIHHIMRRYVPENDRLLLWLGAYSFVIYLLNTLFIGGARVVLGAVAPLTGLYFVAAAIVLTVVGILGPIYTKKWLFDRVGFLRRMTN